ncbi:Hypothetical protein, no similarity [Geotrichum candidum]|uniref:Uncharacterized protein n=1 Tax=Geotrichum candidum TaxID=1173061 RepID=A0A0J9X823_GEOCN|nr:Hypothetical protein, no similarity [Geotrichum candidum]
MVRPTQNSADRAADDAPLTQPDTPESLLLPEDTIPPSNSPQHDATPVLTPPFNSSHHDAISTLPSSAPISKPTAEEVKAMVDDVSRRAFRSAPHAKSTALFPYLLEPDRTVWFPFSTDFNKHYAKTTTYSPGRFDPKHKPEDNWPAFVEEVWKHLEHYSAEGISPEQYAVMLKPHFPPVIWAHIYEAHVSSKPSPADRAYACKTVLHVYTIECYTFEARVQDFNNFLAGENRPDYYQSAVTFNNKFADLCRDTLYANYLHLLQIARLWSSSERSQFFNIRLCLNDFQAPEYDKVTVKIISQAITHGIQVSGALSRSKRQLTNSASSRPPGKRFKKGSNKARSPPFSSPSAGTPTITCTTDKFTRTFSSWSCWMRSRPLKELLNSTWEKTGPKRNFQPFQLPTINKPLSITRYERDFRSQHNLCTRCGNHSDDDDKQCELHPLYDDVKINDKTILGRDLLSFLNSTSITALFLISKYEEIKTIN